MDGRTDGRTPGGYNIIRPFFKRAYKKAVVNKPSGLEPLKFCIVPDHALQIMEVVRSCNGAG